MKKVALLLALLLGTALVGCSRSTLVDTAPERKGRIAMQHSIDLRQAVEDWDYLWLQERNTRLSQWHPYAGY